MRGKISILISIFSKVVSAIFLFTSIHHVVLYGLTTVFRMQDILFILLIGFLAALLYLPFLFENNFSKVMMIILQAAYFLLINAIVLFIGFKLDWIRFSSSSSIIGLELVIIAVYVITMLVSYKLDYNTAEKMNDMLEKRKNQK
ncbi:MAG: DUF3021 family protein [Treponema sp.]|nr:DUF3021 family protein [Treponema sp.]